MFNNLIRRSFDSIIDGGYVSAKTYLNPTVGHALHCILTELLQVAEGRRSADSFPVAIQKFKRYFDETRSAMRRGLRNVLPNLRTASLEQEIGCRVACSFEHFISYHPGENWKRPYIVNGLFPTIKAWLDQPEPDEIMVIVLESIKSFNVTLDDNVVQTEFVNEQDWLTQY